MSDLDMEVSEELFSSAMQTVVARYDEYVQKESVPSGDLGSPKQIHYALKALSSFDITRDVFTLPAARKGAVGTYGQEYKERYQAILEYLTAGNERLAEMVVAIARYEKKGTPSDKECASQLIQAAYMEYSMTGTMIGLLIQ